MVVRGLGVFVVGGLMVALASCSGSSNSGSESSGTQSSGTQSSGSSGSTSGQSANDAGGGTGASDASATSSSDGATAQADLPPMPSGLHGPSKPWAQMTPEERGHYMNEAVVPTMGALLHAYDANRFANVTCRTCHGANAREVHFHMPNSLPALPMPGSDPWNQWMQRDPRMFQFMATRVEQAQAQLLGVEPYNMQTRQGFGCFNCHPHAP